MTQTSKEYAEALFALAAEEDMTEQFYNDLRLVLSEFRENPVYADFLSSPSIPLSERLNAIDEAFSQSVCEYVDSFLKILCQKDNIRLVYRIIMDFEELYRISKGISTARIISAVPLKKAEKEKLLSKLEKMTGKTVVPEYITSPSVLGGLVIYVDGRVLDGSLRRRLHDIKEVIEK